MGSRPRIRPCPVNWRRRSHRGAAVSGRTVQRTVGCSMLTSLRRVLIHQPLGQQDAVRRLRCRGDLLFVGGQ